MEKSTVFQIFGVVCLICQALALDDPSKVSQNIDNVQKHNLKLLTEQLNRGWRAFCKFVPLTLHLGPTPNPLLTR